VRIGTTHTPLTPRSLTSQRQFPLSHQSSASLGSAANFGRCYCASRHSSRICIELRPVQTLSCRYVSAFLAPLFFGPSLGLLRPAQHIRTRVDSRHFSPLRLHTLPAHSSHFLFLPLFLTVEVVARRTPRTVSIRICCCADSAICQLPRRHPHTFATPPRFIRHLSSEPSPCLLNAEPLLRPDRSRLSALMKRTRSGLSSQLSLHATNSNVR
jgi:hypothetical protein